MTTHIIVFCNSAADVTRLFDFVRENEDDYKFIRKYRRSDFRRIDSDGRVFSCKDGKAEFKMRLMFDTRNYVV